MLVHMCRHAACTWLCHLHAHGNRLCMCGQVLMSGQTSKSGSTSQPSYPSYKYIPESDDPMHKFLASKISQEASSSM